MAGIFPSDCRPLLTKSAHGSLPGRHSTQFWALPLCIQSTGEVSQSRSFCPLLRCPLPSIAAAETQTSRAARVAGTQTSKVIATGSFTPDVVLCLTANCKAGTATASFNTPAGGAGGGRNSPWSRLCVRASVYDLPCCMYCHGSR